MLPRCYATHHAVELLVHPRQRVAHGSHVDGIHFRGGHLGDGQACKVTRHVPAGGAHHAQCRPCHAMPGAAPGMAWRVCRGGPPSFPLGLPGMRPLLPALVLTPELAHKAALVRREHDDAAPGLARTSGTPQPVDVLLAAAGHANLQTAGQARGRGLSALPGWSSAAQRSAARVVHRPTARCPPTQPAAVPTCSTRVTSG